MFASKTRRAMAIICGCVALGGPAVVAPPASADDSLAGWVAGKLISGAGSGVASYALGNVMARVGLDPTTNALEEISAQLKALSAQISDLQETSDKTLRDVLKGSFDTRFDQLDISTITRFEADIACYVDANRSQGKRDECWAHFKSQAVGAQLWRIADKFNDLLTNPGSTIVQAYAKSVLGTRRFYTVGDQRRVNDLLTYLDDLQTSATLASVEAENLGAVGKGPDAVADAEAAARVEAETLEERRTAQLDRNPTYPNAGVLDTRLKLWLSTSWQGQTDFPFDKIGAPGDRHWHLPWVDQLLNMVQARGDKTVKRYLVEDAGMGGALARADEYGPEGELWTSTAASTCGFVIMACWKAVSTNNADVRTYNTSIKAGGGPKLFSFLIRSMDPEENARYQFLWR